MSLNACCQEHELFQTTLTRFTEHLRLEGISGLSCLSALLAQAGSPTLGYPASRPGGLLPLGDPKLLPSHMEDNPNFLLTWLETNFSIRKKGYVKPTPSFL